MRLFFPAMFSVHWCLKRHLLRALSVLTRWRIWRKYFQFMADTILGAENSWSLQLQLQESSSSTADVKNKQNIWKPQVCPPFCCCCSSFLSFAPSSSFKQVRFYELLLVPPGNTLCIPRATASTVSAHIQEKFISIFISMNIFLHFFFLFVGWEKKISQSGFGGCAPGCSVEVGSLEEIIRKGNCAQREEKSLRYPRWKILLLCLKVHARRATLLECLNINSSAG